jgi:cell division protease FtsH
VSIIARGMMGGYTRALPAEDRYLWTKSQFEDRIAAALGGQVAERVVFNEISTGASNDIETATNIARKMVCEYGMSERLGPVALGHKEEMVFLGRELGEQKNYSDRIAETIDEEVRGLIDGAWKRAESIITEHRDVLDRLAEELARTETLEGDALMSLFGEQDSGQQPPAPAQPAAPQGAEESADRPAPQPRPQFIPNPSPGYPSVGS